MDEHGDRLLRIEIKCSVRIVGAGSEPGYIEGDICRRKRTSIKRVDGRIDSALRRTSGKYDDYGCYGQGR